MSSKHHSVKKIKNTVEKIIRYVQEKKNKSITDPIEIEYTFTYENPEIQKEFPWIVKTICQDKDLKPLFYMIKELELVETGKKTFKETETELSTKLSTRYIPNKLKD